MPNKTFRKTVVAILFIIFAFMAGVVFYEWLGWGSLGVSAVVLILGFLAVVFEGDS